MITDSLTNFLQIGSNLALSLATAGTVYSDVVDLAGSGAGTPPGGGTGNIIGNATTFGEDSGIGGVKPQVLVSVGTAATTGNAATLTVQFQAAPDTAVTYQPGTYVTLVEQPGITAAQLAANAVIARFDFPPAFPANLNPRYLRLAFVTAASTAFTAGTIAAAVVTMVRDDQANKYGASNFRVA